jgi:undecaprenyl-diphosphatase
VDLLSAALLGVIQGLTEFLPVSSSAHLLLSREFFGWDAGRYGIPFDVACHVGTLVAVLAYFRHDVWKLIEALPGALTGRGGEYEKLGRLIIAGTIPIVIIGALLADQIETTFRSPALVAVALVVGGIGLIAAERLGTQRRSADQLSYGHAALVGVAQAAALVPGVSRSGATITMGMLLGVDRQAAARFGFLLSPPAIIAAAAKEAFELRHVGAAAIPVSIFAVGLVSSALVGYVTVKYFMRFLATQSLSVFAYYRFALAAVTVAWLVTR